jgi:hypothetical protein
MRKRASKSRVLYHKRDLRRVNGRRIKEKRATSPLVHMQHWTRRQRLRVLCQQRNKHDFASEDQLTRIARILGDLHLPFLAPGYEQSAVSDKQ